MDRHVSDACMEGHISQQIQAYQRTQPDAVYLLVALDAIGSEDGFHSIRYFRLGTDGAAVEWIKGEPSPFVANALWVVFPEDLEC